jgi:hypothetical protein
MKRDNRRINALAVAKRERAPTIRDLVILSTVSTLAMIYLTYIL